MPNSSAQVREKDSGLGFSLHKRVYGYGVNTLKTKEVADLWEVSDQRVRVILAELEALGGRCHINFG